jgi:hypothetical protein
MLHPTAVKHEMFVADVTQAYTNLKKAVQEIHSATMRVDPLTLQMGQPAAKYDLHLTGDKFLMSAQPKADYARF